MTITPRARCTAFTRCGSSSTAAPPPVASTTCFPGSRPRSARAATASRRRRALPIKNAGIVDEIENPNPLAGTNNWYVQDGYGSGSYGMASFGGGSYTACADTSQPGVLSIVNYLKSVNVNPNCQSGYYYLLNNYNPGYYG